MSEASAHSRAAPGRAALSAPVSPIKRVRAGQGDECAPESKAAVPESKSAVPETETESECFEEEDARPVYRGALNVPSAAPTELALRLHREVVTDVHAFCTSPVPVALGTLQCSLRAHHMAGEGLFGARCEVWELRITDPRVRYEGVGRFTNVPGASGVGGSCDGPRPAELAKDRLVLVAEARTRGVLRPRRTYIMAMADCSSFHQRVDAKRASHLVGKLVTDDVRGTRFTGYSLSDKLRARSGVLLVSHESLHVEYECRVNKARVLRVAIPRPMHNAAEQEEEEEEAEEEAEQKAGAHKRLPLSKSRELERLWKNDVAPLEDPDLGVRVIPAHEREESLGKRPFTSGLCFSSRRAYWDESVGALVLDFAGRVTEASVKNFQIEPSANATSHQAGVDNDDNDEHLLVKMSLSDTLVGTQLLV
jgi:hypothetical protein